MNENYPNAPQGPAMNQYPNNNYGAPNGYGGPTGYSAPPPPQQPIYNNYYNTQPQNNDYYRPIRPWGYIGYNLLYAIPLVGFIMLIVNAVSNDNINKRNYARSFLWAILLVTIIYILMFILIAIVAVVSNQ